MPASQLSSSTIMHYRNAIKFYFRIKLFIIFGGSFLLFTTVAILLGKSPPTRLDQGLSISEFGQKYGYNITNETLNTKDGYILTMHRMKCTGRLAKCKGKEKHPPILLMHGLLGSSADYLAAGPNSSLAFKLVDQGYDVWLGNNRGNTYSRRHLYLNADIDSLFWNFSYHEIGETDIPAMIDHIIARTNSSKITYVGMSQGCIAYLIMTSLRPEYNDKILLSNVMAPVTTLYDTRNIIFRLLSIFNFFIEPFLNIIGHQELLGDTTLTTKLHRYTCIGPHIIGNWLCTELLFKYMVGSSDQLNYDVIPFHQSISPAGISSKEILHFLQNRKTGVLSQYNYYYKNEKYYGQRTPPIYNLEKSNAPLAVYYSEGDVFTNVQRLHQELSALPNVVLKYKVPYEYFNHLDFIFAKDLNILVNDKLIEMINKYNKFGKNN